MNPRILVAIATLCLSLSAASAEGRAPAPTAAPDSHVLDLGEQSRSRQELGLSAEPNTVKKLMAQASKPSVVIDGGVVMTQAERSEMVDLDEDANRLASEIRSNFGASPSYGGMYIIRGSGRVAVQVVGEATDMRTWMAGLRDADRLEVQAARFSYGDLQRVAGELLGSVVSAPDGTSRVTATDVSERDNAVLVSLSLDTPSVRLAVERSLPAGMLAFTEPASLGSTGVNRLDAPPLAGGQRITRPGEQADRITICTSAFVGYNTVTAPLTTFRNYFLITAGHCGGDDTRPWAQSGENVALGPYPIGTADRNTFAGETAADSQRIAIRPADAALVVRISRTQSNVMSSQQSRTADVAGERVCMSGATTGEIERCGTLVSRDFGGVTAEGPTLVRHRTASWFSLGGDSGGSVYDRTIAKGVIFGNVTYGAGTTSEVRRGVYSHIGEVLPALGVARVS